MNTSSSSQRKALQEACGFAAEQRSNLRKAIQQWDLETALVCGIRLANELRSAQLSPASYYKLYAVVSWELRHLADFVAKAHLHGLSLEKVFELVQYEGNAVPRLYMVVTVGSVYARASDEGYALLDEVSRRIVAVQHPVRGLFLRYYLLQMVKDKLLHLGDIREALRFLHRNLRESASLWARLRLGDGATGEADGSLPEEAPASPSAASQDTSARQVWWLDHRRHTLRFLVGANLVHMARLPGLTVQLHAEVVLPEALRVVLSCEDAPGQAYLLSCFIEAFPDEFHLRTLSSVLEACGKIHWLVDLKMLLQDLLRRFTAHLKRVGPGSVAGVDTFALFHAHFRLLHTRPRSEASPLSSLLGLQLELALSALKLYPGDASRMELVLCDTVSLVQQRGSESLSAPCVRAVMDILSVPLTQEALVPAILAMPHHSQLMAALRGSEQRDAALSMVTALLAGDVQISDSDTVRRLLVLADRLVRDDGGGGVASWLAESTRAMRHLDFNPQSFRAEQEKVARLVHQVRHADPDVAFEMLSVARGYFEQGGPHRTQFTMPAMVVATLRLVRLIQQEHLARNIPKTTLGAVFQLAHSMCASLGALDPEENLGLWLLCAAAVEGAERAKSAIGVEHGNELAVRCNDFIEGALSCITASFKDPQAQFQGLQMLVATIRDVTCLRGDRMQRLTDRAMFIAGRMPTKQLQCQAHTLCACLFWSPACREPIRALTCLRQALGLADSAVSVNPTDIGLFIEVLDQAVYLCGEGTDSIQPAFLSSVLLICIQHIRYLPRCPPEVTRALQTTLRDLQMKQSKALERAGPAQYSGLQLEFAAKVMEDPSEYPYGRDILQAMHEIRDREKQPEGREQLVTA